MSSGGEGWRQWGGVGQNLEKGGRQCRRGLHYIGGLGTLYQLCMFMSYCLFIAVCITGKKAVSIPASYC